MERREPQQQRERTGLARNVPDQRLVPPPPGALYCAAPPTLPGRKPSLPCWAAGTRAHLEQPIAAGGDHAGQVRGEVQAEDLRGSAGSDNVGCSSRCWGRQALAVRTADAGCRRDATWQRQRDGACSKPGSSAVPRSAGAQAAPPPGPTLDLCPFRLMAIFTPVNAPSRSKPTSYSCEQQHSSRGKCQADQLSRARGKPGEGKPLSVESVLAGGQAAAVPSVHVHRALPGCARRVQASGRSAAPWRHALLARRCRREAPPALQQRTLASEVKVPAATQRPSLEIVAM